MKSRKLIAAGATCALALPAAALADPFGPSMALDPKARAAKARIATHRVAVRRNVRLARIEAWRIGRPLPSGYRSRARLRSLEELQRSNVRLRASVARLRVLRAAVAALRPTLRAIAFCESRHNARAAGAGGRYRGLFQFDLPTWASVGGRGDPALASTREQYLRAAMLYRRVGRSAWPVCGR